LRSSGARQAGIATDQRRHFTEASSSKASNILLAVSHFLVFLPCPPVTAPSALTPDELTHPYLEIRQYPRSRLGD
jgi:hypothetical protein